jgi:hypothetical protein
MAWFHEDGTLCVAGHVRHNRLCVEGGGPVHDTTEEISRLHRELALVERVSKEATDGLNRRLSALESEPKTKEPGEPMLVYLPQYVDPADNVWDGRTSYGVYTSLAGALSALQEFSDPEGLLVTTESSDTSGGSSHCVAVYMVHRESEPPRRDGSLWIFVEKVIN